MLAATFHPELTGEDRLHRFFTRPRNERPQLRNEAIYTGVACVYLGFQAASRIGCVCDFHPSLQNAQIPDWANIQEQHQVIALHLIVAETERGVTRQRVTG